MVALETFTAAVDRLRVLYAEDLVGIEIAPDGSVQISLRPEASDHAPEPGGGLYVDIEDTLTAVLNGATVDEFAKARSAIRPMTVGPGPTIAIGGSLRREILRQLRSAESTRFGEESGATPTV